MADKHLRSGKVVAPVHSNGPAQNPNLAGTSARRQDCTIDFEGVGDAFNGLALTSQAIEGSTSPSNQCAGRRNNIIPTIDAPISVNDVAPSLSSAIYSPVSGNALPVSNTIYSSASGLCHHSDGDVTSGNYTHVSSGYLPSGVEPRAVVNSPAVATTANHAVYSNGMLVDGMYKPKRSVTDPDLAYSSAVNNRWGRMATGLHASSAHSMRFDERPPLTNSTVVIGHSSCPSFQDARNGHSVAHYGTGANTSRHNVHTLLGDSTHSTSGREHYERVSCENASYEPSRSRNEFSHDRPPRFHDPLLNGNHPVMTPRHNYEVPTSSRPRFTKPPRFDGKFSEWRYFKDMFLRTCRINAWSFDEQVLHLMGSLEGEAKEFAMSMDYESMSLNEWLDRLESRFGCVRNARHYMTLLNSKTWNTNENPRKYADDLRRLVKLAYPDSPSHYQNALIMNHFIQGIGDKDLQLQLNLHPPHSLERAIEFVESFYFHNVRMKKTHHSVRMVAPYPESDDEDEDTSAESDGDSELDDAIQFIASRVNSKHGKSTGKASSREFRKGFVKDKTFAAHKFSPRKEHVNRRTTYPYQPSYEPVKEQVDTSKSDWSRVKCYHCEGRGHYKNECPGLNRIMPLNSNRPIQRGEEAKSSPNPRRM